MADLLPVKSRTDPPAPEDNSSKRHERPRRIRASSFRSKEHPHRHRPHVRETVQSAIELKPPITFDHILRRDKKDSDSSRRGSSNTHQQQQQQQQLDGTNSSRQPREKPIQQDDVDKAKEENAKREENLRESLKAVEDVGMSSTRQLDDTYYAILEKASILRSLVANLQQMADESRKMHESFLEDTSKLERDTKQSVQSFGNFSPQEQKINDLASKLEASRGKTNELNDRLESARLRVEAYEERENTKSARRRTRLNITWITLLGVVFFVVAILVAKNRRAVGKKLDLVSGRLVGLGDIVDDVVAPISTRLRPSPSEDPYLRKLFDEL